MPITLNPKTPLASTINKLTGTLTAAEAKTQAQAAKTANEPPKLTEEEINIKYAGIWNNIRAESSKGNFNYSFYNTDSKFFEEFEPVLIKKGFKVTRLNVDNQLTRGATLLPNIRISWD